MKASVTIAGIEVALAGPPGQLERVVAGRYAPFLGTIEAPVCTVPLNLSAVLDPVDQETRATVEPLDNGYVVIHPGFRIVFHPREASRPHCAANPATVDHALRILFGLLAPQHDALLLEAAGVISAAGAHLFVGPAGAMRSAITGLAGTRPVLTDGFVMVRRKTPGRWLAAATPFWANGEHAGPPRHSQLACLWSLHRVWATEADPVDAEAIASTLFESVAAAGPDPATRQAMVNLTADLATAVPSSDLAFAPSPESWRGIDAFVA